jgi:carboxyl-terminal processing protease
MMFRTHLLVPVLLAGACAPAGAPNDPDGPDGPGEAPPSAPTQEIPTEEAPTWTGPWCEGNTGAHEAFRAFWTDFDERYAVFDAHLPAGGWYELGGIHCAAMGDDPSDDQLFDAMIGLARELDDGHVNLCAPSRGCEDAWVSVYPEYPALYSAELQVEEHYLDRRLAWAANDWFAWGPIGDVGYVSITSMDGLSAGGNEGGDVTAAHTAMERVLGDLGGSRGLVIDVRANEGGWDSVSLAIATWFVGGRAEAWTEQIRNGPAHDDFSEPEPVFVQAAQPGAFDGPVVLLTSGGTFSAAETFVLAMRVREDVTVLGEPTSGHLSDLIDGKLPNDWRFTLSAERYLAGGALYEALGVPVEVAVPFDPQALQAGQDTQLEAALDLLQ